MVRQQSRQRYKDENRRSTKMPLSSQRCSVAGKEGASARNNGFEFETGRHRQ